MREMRQLSGFFNPAADRLAASIGTRTTTCSMSTGLSGDTAPPVQNMAFEQADISEAFEQADVAIDALFDAGHFGHNYAMFVSDPAIEAEEPKSYFEAWNHHPNFTQRAGWCNAINKEFANMAKRKVWTKIKRREIPPGRRCVKHRWVWNIKRNGIFRARLVACGYSQVAGIDYNEIFAPVINDVTYRILLIVKILLKLKGVIVDVEAAFLHGDLEGCEIYMDAPEGLNAAANECVLLLKGVAVIVWTSCRCFVGLSWRAPCQRPFGGRMDST
jgi:hypothetical protein